MYVVVWLDWFVDEECDGFGLVEEWSVVFVE